VAKAAAWGCPSRQGEWQGSRAMDVPVKRRVVTQFRSGPGAPQLPLPETADATESCTHCANSGCPIMPSSTKV